MTTPNDTPEPSLASAGSQGPDITVRLRRWTHSVDAVFASDIMDEAAGVIEKLRRRLRLLDAAVRSQPTLTDEERAAIERLCEAVTEYSDIDRKESGCHADDDMAAVAVARGLMKRMV